MASIAPAPSSSVPAPVAPDTLDPGRENSLSSNAPEPAETIVRRASNPLNSKGKALFIACKFGQLEVARFLLNNDPDINWHDADGNSCLYWAVRGGHAELTIDLVRAGANPYWKDADGLLPLQRATLAKVMNRSEMVDALMTAGVDINWLDGDKNNVLFWAIEGGFVQPALELIRAGIDVNWVDSDGLTALQRSTDSLAIVQALLEAGANVNARSPSEVNEREDLNWRNRGYSPLHWAAEGGETEVVIALLEVGADIYALDKFKRTPLDVARKCHHRDTVHVLKKARGGRFERWFWVCCKGGSRNALRTWRKKQSSNTDNTRSKNPSVINVCERQTK